MRTVEGMVKREVWGLLLLALFCPGLLLSASPVRAGFDLATFPHRTKLVFEAVPEVGNDRQASGEAVLKLRIYDTASGGEPLYEEEHRVKSEKGKLKVEFDEKLIAAARKAGLPSADKLWLEVEYAGEILSPRLSLAAAGEKRELVGATRVLAAAGLRMAVESGLILSEENVEAFVASERETSLAVANAYGPGSGIGAVIVAREARR